MTDSSYKVLDDSYTVLHSRPQPSANFDRVLQKNGLAVVHVPLITIVPPVSWEAADEVLGRLLDFDGILFTSLNAVNAFFTRAEKQDVDVSSLPLFAVGPRTAEAITAKRQSAEVVSAGGAKELAMKLGDVRNKIFLQPASDIARPELADAVKSGGGEVRLVTVYRTLPASARETDRLRALVRKNEVQCAAFFSPSAVRHFASALVDYDLSSICIAAIGTTTAEQLLASGLRVDVVADRQTEEGLAEAIVEFTGRSKRNSHKS